MNAQAKSRKGGNVSVDFSAKVKKMQCDLSKAFVWFIGYSQIPQAKM